MNKKLSDIEEKVSKFLKQRLKPKVAIVFGSFAQKRMNRDSDIDIAYWGGIKTTVEERFLLAEDLAEILHCDVDLVALEEVNVVFQMQILTTGKILFGKNITEWQFFEMRVFKEYVYLNEERKEVLEMIRQRGSIYAK